MRDNPILKAVQQRLREHFPVPALPFMHEMKANLGLLFLNQDESAEGDWIVTVSESG